ncbi:hypothetical protein [Microbulbifer thermotolerans]|uniref:Lipoprotein n=1 Tax=Microbulbifer thermotolerans TaxID=252514 RepID=A0A143HJ39_MICTH|nr:hypothetical protein [Microbulbifer thermotolerans]AMX01683.1 hypothetical protein A3224_03005 [Microbulbifer thermotolerans]MCX2779452.1 hypothetical protein [Microbulbifer thermotolerans]MCX2784036.1 hypothetical protein [Microbulbifer thermotolerans]MCX2793323.1 hypothetical protein [Microbulbifer thermotolerans]MCX2801261.1 hypothetical protein [Microbulbifer thermotolerans]
MFKSLFVFSLALISGCTTVVIDEYRRSDGELAAGDTVVILGRRHSSEYETEPDLIDCVGRELHDPARGVKVIPEKHFLDAMYPWFEPRTAPMHLRSLDRLLEIPNVRERMEAYGVKYIVWIDGSTETTASAGSIGCSIGTGGAGCFGFGTWDKESDYEASVWDFRDQELSGKLSADAKGTSYMPAIVVPIPLIARVQNNACKGMAAQLQQFLLPANGKS